MSNRDLIFTKRKLFNFVEEFLGWQKTYFNNYNDINSTVALDRLIKVAEDHYMDLIRENEKIAEKNHKKLIQIIENFDLGEFPPKPKKNRRVAKRKKT